MKDTIPTLNSIWVSNRLYNLNVSTINYSGSVIPWNLRHDPLIFQWHLIWRIQNFQFKFQLLESSERGLKKFVPRNMYRGNGAIEVKTGKRRTFETKVYSWALNFSVPIYLRQTQLTEEHKLNIIVRSFEISIAETKIPQLISKAFTYMLVAASDIWQTL